ncbi:HAMP domain-containing protein [Paenibacillus thalictri]|uniref:histidine kinase n=1 Tax=Paenibacillus thalictri TaxID=2527873 RepID=A0A4Q9DIV7_9BACL|nr:HAMP domain-containing sensor histidine kinase [Paenibacillus thalictri]TBL70334.1 HAMP domain-containing protein [Paenibacillus thalictri]
MPGLNRSIFLRLLFSSMLTMLLGLCAVGLLVSFFTKDYFTEFKKEELLRKAKKVNLAMQNTSTLNEDSKDLLLFFDQSYDTRIWLFDRNGKIVATSSQDEVSIGKAVDPSVVKKVTSGESAVLRMQPETITQPTLAVVVPWGKDDKVYGGIVLHTPITGVKETIRGLRETILWASLFGIVLSAGIAAYLSWSISRPIQMIDRSASRIGMGDYSERIRISSKDEIGDLAATLNKMAEKLEQTDREKKKSEQIRTHFLANVSHELRTPLTAIQGFLEALQDGLIEETGRQKYYSILYNETLHMSRLVDDLLDLIRLENEEVSLALIPLDVGPMLEKAAFKFAPEAADKETSLIVWVEDDVPKMFADYDRIEQILNNLIKNAVKFTERGQIRIAADKDGDYVRLTVADTGRGIPERDRELIWERFFKADSGRSDTKKGTGLGLSIVKELVKLHNGTVTVESAVDQGTMFTIRIPSVNMS